MEAPAPPQLRPLGIGEVLDVALKIVWRNLKTLVTVVVFVVLPVQVLSALLTASVSDDAALEDSFTTAEDGTATFTGGSSLNTFIGFVVAVGLLGVVSSTLSSGACFRAIASAYLGERTGWRDSLKFAVRRFPSLLWITILTGLAVFAGVIACVIPGIYLWVAFTVAVPVMLTEDIRGTKALGRSRRLVAGFWWRAFGVAALGYLLSSILSGAIQGVLIGVSTVEEGTGSAASILVTVFAGTASSVLTTPFVAAFVTVLYFDLRVRKEAFDLQLLAQRIGVEPPAGALAAPLAPEPGPGDDKPPFWPPPPGWKPRSTDDS